MAKRLVEVGQTVEVGQPLATLDEVDLKLQAEQAVAEFTAATGVVAQAVAAEQRAKDLRAKGWTTDAQMDSARAAADEARARLNRAERSVDLTKNSLSYATLAADARGVVTATLIEPGQVVAAGQTAIRVARFAEKEAVVAIPETLVERAKTGSASVTLWSEPNRKYSREAARDFAERRSRNPHLSRQILAARRRRQGRTRHDRDLDAVRPEDRARGAAAVVGALRRRRQALVLRRRRCRRHRAEARHHQGL